MEDGNKNKNKDSKDNLPPTSPNKEPIDKGKLRLELDLDMTAASLFALDNSSPSSEFSLTIKPAAIANLNLSPSPIMRNLKLSTTPTNRETLKPIVSGHQWGQTQSSGGGGISSASSSSSIDSFKASLQQGQLGDSSPFSGKLKISPELQFDFTAEDLEDLGEIGRGAYGTVNKMKHKMSGVDIAVKRIRCTVDEREQKKLKMDLEVVMKSNACPFIVKFFGAIFKEGDCWICMELMDASLDQFYKFVYRKMGQRIGEDVIGRIALATVHALNYLKDHLRIIHRDIKPSNILLDRGGNIKLCDFGISGQLVDSIAQSRDAGCRPYMAPERIDPSSARGYDIRSDVWSLGITLYEISTGVFPYPKWNSIFEQLCQVVQGDPPQLLPNMNGMNFSPDFVSFVNICLIKDELQRPKYSRLLQHNFLLRSARDSEVNVKSYFSQVFTAMGPQLLKRLEDLTLLDDY